MESSEACSGPPGGFAEALQKAKQFAAKLQSGGLKRPFDGSTDSEPDTKKMLSPGNDGDQRPFGITDPGRASTAAQIAAAKASQINAKLGISGAAPSNLPEMAQPTHSETMMVPDHMVGLLIGKGGEQIAAIQSETQCMIQFASEGGKPERVCTITGTAASVAKGKDSISRLVQKFRNAGPNPSYGGSSVASSGSGDEGLGMLEMMVPGTKVGLIIGKGGETIKMLMETTGSKIVVVQDSKMPSNHDKPVRISGDRNSCQRAKEKILDLLADRDLQMYSGPSGYKTNLEFPVPRSMVGVIIGKGGEMIKQIQDESGSRVQFKPEDDNGGPFRICTVIGEDSGNRVAENLIKKLVESGMQRQNEPDGNGRGGRRPDGPIGGNFGGQDGTSYPVPAEKCGLVIGKGGETIRDINRVSGAHVELDRNSGNNPMERLFRIRGSPEQIQHAIQLINEKTGAQHNDGQGYQGPMGGPMGRPIGGPMGGPNPYGPPVPQGIPPHQPGMPYQQPMHQQPPQQPQHPGMMPGQPAWNAGYPQPQQPQPQYRAQPVMNDPTKPANDPNAAAWAAYYAQFYGQPGVPGAQPTAQPAPVQAQQQTAYSAAAPVASPMPAASATAAPSQPQPTINPQTGQPDYSAAWADYYRQMGLHQHAAAIMQTMQQHPQQ